MLHAESSSRDSASLGHLVAWELLRLRRVPRVGFLMLLFGALLVLQLVLGGGPAGLIVVVQPAMVVALFTQLDGLRAGPAGTTTDPRFLPTRRWSRRACSRRAGSRRWRSSRSCSARQRDEVVA